MEGFVFVVGLAFLVLLASALARVITRKRCPQSAEKPTAGTRTEGALRTLMLIALTAACTLATPSASSPSTPSASPLGTAPTGTTSRASLASATATQRALMLGEVARVPSFYRNLPDAPAEFSVTVLDFVLATAIPSSGGTTTTPPPGAKFVLYLVRATNVSQVPGKPPLVGASFRGSGLAGFPCALGGRAAFDSESDLYPGITTEGWECRVVQAAATGADDDLRAKIESSSGLLATWALRK